MTQEAQAPVYSLTYADVTKDYGPIKALRGVTLDIKKGEIFGFIGPDGAGKSTMIRTAMGIINPTSGVCTLLGSRDRKSSRDNAGYVPQLFSLYTDMTVMENINLFGSLYGKPRSEVHKRAEYILSRVGLWGFKDRFAGNLSGGMKQKLALAIGLLNTPEILLLDEPTTGVDPVARREFWALLYQFNHEGLTIVVSTPYMDEAELCTRKMFISNGRILDVGTTAELLGRYPYKLLCLELNSRTAFTWLAKCAHVIESNMFGSVYHIVTDDPEAAQASIKAALAEHGVGDAAMYPIEPTLGDLFVAFAGKDE